MNTIKKGDYVLFPTSHIVEVDNVPVIEQYNQLCIVDSFEFMSVLLRPLYVLNGDMIWDESYIETSDFTRLIPINSSPTQ
jgi:hypothetical protein